ncbi:hypothetical protein NMY22_g19588 [Coprinellus aureogranulatus]|nr:hypothetical protein NMY22_g19588 [Coprinellus aureogranulatus]
MSRTLRILHCHRNWVFVIDEHKVAASRDDDVGECIVRTKAGCGSGPTFVRPRSELCSALHEAEKHLGGPSKCSIPNVNSVVSLSNMLLILAVWKARTTAQGHIDESFQSLAMNDATVVAMEQRYEGDRCNQRSVSFVVRELEFVDDGNDDAPLRSRPALSFYKDRSARRALRRLDVRQDPVAMVSSWWIG